MASVPPDIAATAEAVAARQIAPQILVLMGVSGSGKSTIGRELQRVLGWPFQEGDDLHPPANVEKMRSGQPLDDDDRLPWLLAVARWIDGQLAAHQPGIITCSDLKRAYRDITIGQRRGVTLVYLKGDEAVIHERLLHRQHHYMPLSLLASQLETLEAPAADERAITVVVHASLADTVLELLRKLARRGGSRSIRRKPKPPTNPT